MKIDKEKWKKMLDEEAECESIMAGNPEFLGVDVNGFDPEKANEANKGIIEAFSLLQDISYDGLYCPQCSSPTVQSSGYLWCPSVNCNWGNELKLPEIITKWIVR